MTKNESKKLMRLINDYAKAKVDRSWMGSRMPDEHEEIEKNLKSRHQVLKDFIKSLETKEGLANDGESSRPGTSKTEIGSGLTRA